MLYQPVETNRVFMDVSATGRSASELSAALESQGINIGAMGEHILRAVTHMDVNAIDLVGAAGDTDLTTALEVAAADNLKRVRRAPATEPDWTQTPGLATMTDFVEIKTVWHPMGV